MTKTGRKSSGVGRGENLAGDGAILNALAVEILDQEAIERQKELRKLHRKGAERNQVVLADLDHLYKKRNEPVSDLLADIKRRLHYMGAFFKPIRAQYDMFITASESPDAQYAASMAGRLAGLSGKDAKPPPTLVGEDLQLWEEAYTEASKARKAAEKDRKEEEKKLLETLAAALGAPEGTVLNGTGKGDIVERVRAQATADGEEERLRVESLKTYAPAGEVYVLNGEAPLPSGRLTSYKDGEAFSTVEPNSSTAGYDAHPKAPAAAGDGFEATAEELNLQKARQAVIESREAGAEPPSEEEIAAGVKKLLEEGFAGEKPKNNSGIKPPPARQRRLPGESTK